MRPSTLGLREVLQAEAHAKPTLPPIAIGGAATTGNGLNGSTHDASGPPPPLKPGLSIDAQLQLDEISAEIDLLDQVRVSPNPNPNPSPNPNPNPNPNPHPNQVDGAGGSEDDGDDGDEKSQRECVICMTEPRDTTVLPCRHMSMCSECAKVLRTKA